MDLSTLEWFENYYETPYVIYGNKSAKRTFNRDFIGHGDTISPIFLMNEVFSYCNMKENEYLQYMEKLKNNIDVMSDYYYKKDGTFVKKEQSKYSKLIKEYESVNYYYSRNFRETHKT